MLAPRWLRFNQTWKARWQIALWVAQIAFERCPFDCYVFFPVCLFALPICPVCMLRILCKCMFANCIVGCTHCALTLHLRSLCILHSLLICAAHLHGMYAGIPLGCWLGWGCCCCCCCVCCVRAAADPTRTRHLLSTDEMRVRQAPLAWAGIIGVMARGVSGAGEWSGWLGWLS